MRLILSSSSEMLVVQTQFHCINVTFHHNDYCYTKTQGIKLMQHLRPIRRALLSVSDKAGILEFAKALVERNVELYQQGDSASISRSWLTRYRSL